MLRRGLSVSDAALIVASELYKKGQTTSIYMTTNSMPWNEKAA